MATPSLQPEQPQFIVTHTLYIKNKNPVNVNQPVPPEHAWLYLMLDQQTQLLNKINGKLTFIVFIIIISVLIAIFFR